MEDKNTRYTIVLIGATIVGKVVRSIIELKGKEVNSDVTFYDTLREARGVRRRRNKMLSLEEKRYYKLLYVIARTQEGIYTGK